MRSAVANGSSSSTASVPLGLGVARAFAYAATTSAGTWARSFLAPASSSGAPFELSPSAGSSAPPNMGTLAAMRNGCSGFSESMTWRNCVFVASSRVVARMARGQSRPCDWATTVGFGAVASSVEATWVAALLAARALATVRASPMSTAPRGLRGRGGAALGRGVGRGEQPGRHGGGALDVERRRGRLLGRGRVQPDERVLGAAAAEREGSDEAADGEGAAADAQGTARRGVRPRGRGSG